MNAIAAAVDTNKARGILLNLPIDFTLFGRFGSA
jgi:hypothetical protein